MARIQPIKPAAGQESVWDYPRPPRIEESHRRIRVIFDGIVIADSTRAKRILETSHPPVYYIPCEDIRMDMMTESSHRSFCEWKGAASYYSIRTQSRAVKDAAWCYQFLNLAPDPAYATIKDHLAFYPSRVDACFVDEEKVEAQAGDFYGGWITKEIVGPFKGESGTWGW